MINEEQIACEIQKFVWASTQTDSPEMRNIAERFAEICAETNLRLMKCSDYLEKNLRAEAVTLAESSPPLLETVDKLDFPEKGEWIDFCKLYDWPVPPEIKNDIAKSLRNAYGEQAFLAPLENEYRRKVHTGTLQGKIMILRKIRSLDSKNRNWEESLVELEKIRIAQLVDESRKAIESDDEEKLKLMYDEMTRPDWILRPEEKVINKVEATLKGLRVGRLRKKADEILLEISKSYSAFDIKKLNNFIAKWDILCSDREFEPCDSDIRQVVEAEEWAAEKNRESIKKRDFNDLATEVEEMLDDKAPFHQISNAFNKLRQFDLEIPEMTLSRYRSAESEHRISAARAFRLKIMIIVISTVVAVVILVFLVNNRIQARMKSDWISQISKAIEEEKIETADKLFEKIKDNSPKIFTCPEMLALSKKLENSKEQRLSRRNRFNDIVSSLKESISQDFRTDLPVDELIREAETLAYVPEEDLMLADIKDARAKFLNKYKREKDAEFLARADELDELSIKMQMIDTVISSEKFALALTDYEKKLNSLLTFTGSTQEVYDGKMKVLQERLKLLRKKYDDGRQEFKDYQRLFGDLYSGAVNLSDFKLALVTFSEKYPDSPQKDRIKKVLDNMEYYEPVVLIRGFTSKILPCKAEYKTIAAGMKGKSIWASDFPSYVEYLEKLDSKSPSVNEFFSKLGTAPLLNYYLVSFCVGKGNKKGKTVEMISNEKPAVNRVSIENGNVIHEIEINRIMDKNDFNGTFWYIRNTASNLWEARVEKKVQFTNLSLINSLADVQRKVDFYSEIARASDQIAGLSPFEDESLLPVVIDAVRKSPGNPYRRLIVLKNIYAQGAEISWEYEKMYQENSARLMELMKKYGEEYDYFNMSDKDKIDVENFIQGEPDLASETKNSLFRRDMIMASLDRSVDFAGVVKNNGGTISAMIKKKDYSGEIWILRIREDGTCSFMIVGIVKDGLCVFDQNIQNSLSDLEPLFAPSDGKSTELLAEAFRKQAEELNVKEIKWPSCWPARGD